MSLASGTRLGPYEIVAPLGAGGMGEVYRATDTRLNRTVAIKAMHALFEQHPERVVRFEREAQLLASLNHPNIAAIHGLEAVEGSKYLVLEFVDGRTLADVLKEGALSVAEAMPIARQIADALAAAHERGIIHRDLKPGNVMVTAEGVVKVLDFGLGKALESEPASETANSPTMTMAATQAGIILGTAGYMSPEQAKGRGADKRSDVWAFGCVLFEMLAGRRAFEGEDLTEVLAAIVRDQPDWTLFPAAAPAAVRQLVEQCLIKNRAERISDMSVVRFLLSDRTHAGSMMSGTAPAVTVPAARARSVGWPVAAGLVAVAVLATAGAMRFWSPAPAAASASSVTRLSIALPEGDLLNWANQLPMAISPDGSTVVYAAQHDGVSRLYLRALSELEPKVLAGTDGAKSPFFSHDGEWIGFFAQGKLKKIAIGGAALQTVTDAPDARGGTWDSDDTIYFTPRNAVSIWKVSAAGGTASEFTTLDRARGETSHRWPHVIPGQQTILFSALTGPGQDERQIVSQSLATGERHVLIQGGATPRYVKTGHLLYGNGDTLFAVPWTPSQTSLAGAVPAAMAELPRLENETALAYGVSDNGTLVYLAGGPSRTLNRVVWVDHSGKTEPLSLPERDYESVVLAPNGSQAVVQVYEGTLTLWMLDLSRQTLTPFLTNGSSQSPLWTTDGTRVIYRGTRSGFRNLYRKAADGTGTEERLTEKIDVVQSPTSVSPDGEWLVFNEGSAGGTGVWKLRLNTDPKAAVPELIFPVTERTSNGVISRDGKWLAFQSEVSGRVEVYVQPFPGPGPRRQVSTTGGSFPLWSRDGRRLYFDSLDNRVMAVDVTTGAAFSAGVPRMLFEGRFKTSANSNTHYDISLDDRRFLRVQQVKPEAGVVRIEVVLNWISQLTRR